MRTRVIGLLGALTLAGCGGDAGAAVGRWSGFNPGAAPADLHRGEVVFNTYCLSCHGLHGAGVPGAGPALVDALFEPARISDEAFLSAMDRGASQRNFNYGAMPPVSRLSREDASQVVRYVRWLQGRARAIDSTASPTLEAR